MMWQYDEVVAWYGTLIKFKLEATPDKELSVKIVWMENQILVEDIYRVRSHWRAIHGVCLNKIKFYLWGDLKMD